MSFGIGFGFGVGVKVRLALIFWLVKFSLLQNCITGCSNTDVRHTHPCEKNADTRTGIAQAARVSVAVIRTKVYTHVSAVAITICISAI